MIIFGIEDIENSCDGYLHITLRDPSKANLFAYPNMFEEERGLGEGYDYEQKREEAAQDG